MNVIDAINQRFACRAFKPDPVDKATILKILEAATHSPSWANTQPWEVYVAAGPILEISARVISTTWITMFHYARTANPRSNGPSTSRNALLP